MSASNIHFRPLNMDFVILCEENNYLNYVIFMFTGDLSALERNWRKMEEKGKKSENPENNPEVLPPGVQMPGRPNEDRLVPHFDEIF